MMQDTSPENTNIPTKKEESWIDIVRFALIALVIVIPIRLYIAQPFIVSGSSMVPTFQDGEYLIVDEISYRLEKPDRGDVIVFRYPNNPSRFFIKRVIGLPNETVSIDNDTITIFNEENPDGFSLDEWYLSDMMHTLPSDTITTLSDEEYFVMGDNREASSDSRIWGSLHERYIIGKAFLRLFPIQSIDVHPGKALFEN
ncbi:MAG: signal peptidase I [Candidatus Pacebacteria bacterium]|nr:signal peptidase I [Candidatus Paceibacterota bacterium]